MPRRFFKNGPRLHWVSVATVGLLASLLSMPTAAAQSNHQASPRPATAPQPNPADISTHTVPGVAGQTAALSLPEQQIAAFREHHTQPAGRPARGKALQSSQATAQPLTFHSDWGVFPSGVTAPTGMMAVQSILPGFATSGGDYLYAPTLYPAGNSCIEATTAYGGGGVQIWAWDWCNRQTLGKAATVNAAFIADYVQNGAYSIWISQTNAANNTWEMYLHNYATSAWDPFYTSSGHDPGNPPGTNSAGYDMFEVYTNTNSATGQLNICPQLAGLAFTSSSIEQQQAGIWTPLTAANVDPGSTSPPQSDLFGCTGLTAQYPTQYSQWQVTATSGGGGGSYPTGYHQLVSSSSGGLCVDVNGASLNTGAAIIQWNCKTSGTANQEFQFAPVTGGYGALLNQNSGLVIAIQNASTSDGAPTVQSTQDGASDSLWLPIQLSNGSWQFQNMNSGLCLDVTGWSATAGTQLEQWDCKSPAANTNQAFTTQ